MGGAKVARHASLIFLIACGAAVIAAPASADTVKFYTGTTAYGTMSNVPFNGAGTVYDATKNGTTACPVGFSGCGAVDIRQNPSEVFNLSDGLTITATVSPSGSTRNPNQVWYDLQPNFGGLGVGLKNGDSDTDQIAGHDILTLTFTNSSNVLHNVELTGVATLFAPAHEDFGSNFSSSSDVKNKASSILFWLSVDGGAFTPISFADANNNALDITGNTFSFEQYPYNYPYYDEHHHLKYKPGPQFYVSALEFLDDVCPFGPNGCTNNQGGNTPLPAAVWLFGSVIAGGAGVSRWRKSRKVRAARAAVSGERDELA